MAKGGISKGDQASRSTRKPLRQLLHLVFGGELKSVGSTEFVDPHALHIVGIYPNFAEAEKAWRGAAQATVDNARMRYFVVHLHRLMDPGTGEQVHSHEGNEDQD
jgi:hypothetical protein